MSKADTINIKRINRSRVFKLISSCDKISKQDIANELSMSLPTVTQNLNELLEMGLISNNGSFVSTVGRRARAILSFPMHELLLVSISHVIISLS